MRAFANNPILNPFFHDQKSEQPDDLVKGRSSAQYGSTDGGDEVHKHASVAEDSASDLSRPTSDYQEGLQKAEAVALVWSKWSLVGAYVGYIFLILCPIDMANGPVAFSSCSSSYHSSHSRSTL